MFSFFNKNAVPTLSVRELESQLGNIQLIDIREPNEYAGGHVPKAKNIPMNTLASNPDQYLKKETTYHIICQSGGRSGKVTRILHSAGFKVVDVTGGTGGYPGKLER